MLKIKSRRTEFLVKTKYQPISLEHWGKDHFVYNFQETEDRKDIYLKSYLHQCKCPDCGVASDHRHSTYMRTLQEVPFCGNKTTYLHVVAYTYDCVNPECQTKTFTESLPFAHEGQYRTDALNIVIIAIAAQFSNNGASHVLRDMGIIIDDKGIQRLRDKIELIDNPDVEFVGIDDVATQKGYKYATAVYDMTDNHLIALLDGRDAQTLKEWLSSHTKIKRITRDGAAAYAKAIKEVLPDCIQISDRFHLLHNLFDKLKKIFNQEVPKEIIIRNGKLDGDNEAAPMIYDNTPATDIDGNPIKFDDHGSICLSQEERRNEERLKKKKQPKKSVKSKGKGRIYQ